MSTLYDITNVSVRPREAIGSKAEVSILKIFPSMMAHMDVIICTKIQSSAKTVLIKSGCLKPCQPKKSHEEEKANHKLFLCWG